MQAILQKQGIKLNEISEYNVLKEFNRLVEKERQVRGALKNPKKDPTMA